MKKLHLFLCFATACAIANGALAQTPLEGTHIQRSGGLPYPAGFVSNGDSVALLLNAIGARMRQPVVVSATARKNKLSGNFDLSEPKKTLDKVSAELGLLWYSDGQSLYVYDASETRSTVGHMRNASIATLNEFLRKADLHDARYPVRGGGADGTFYFAGPPVYLEIVVNAARYIDALYRSADTESSHIDIIKLEHSFVGGRRYSLRNQESTLPGVADIIQNILAQAGGGSLAERRAEAPPAAPPAIPALDASIAPPVSGAAAPAPAPAAPTASAAVLPYPETNSLLVRGTLGQIQVIRDLVRQIDVPKKQIELSLWIIDIKKNELDKLGITWSGEVGIANQFGISFNAGSASTLDGAKFLASINALSADGNASVVSRPILLTQENIPAHFDNNNTFYTEVKGERTAALESVTYGTLVSVLPRISSEEEVEMRLKIEDGAAVSGEGQKVGGLPVVARTTIDTVARVPQSLSLLIGGYTRDTLEEGEQRIPLLGDLPWIGKLFRHRNKLADKLVRVFLIQPRVVRSRDPLDRDAMREQFGDKAALPPGDMYKQIETEIRSNIRSDIRSEFWADTRPEIRSDSRLDKQPYVKPVADFDIEFDQEAARGN